MLARTAAAEIVARQKDLSALAARRIQDEIRLRIALRVIAPVAEELLIEALHRRGLEKARRDDLIGVDIIDRQRNEARFERSEWLHRMVLTSVTTPVMALAAAVMGEARKVRPPLPWRPSKLRLLVDTLYSPGCNWSPFIAIHIEQPGSRQSHPAARKTSGRPSASA